jgi:4-amino-4-deoxy-L-arabinose transferase-like glycosyltransferase
MNNTSTSCTETRFYWAWIAILVTAAAGYTIGISHESFWYDESYSAVMAGYLPWQIPIQVMVDNHPPLYYMLLSLIRMVLGSSEWALRSLSVAGTVGLVALGAGPVRRILGNRNAFLYAVVVMSTPAILIYAHEARMYSLAICAVTAGALYGYLAVKENRKKDWFLFGLATLAAAYLHYYGLIAAFFLHVLIFTWLVTRRRSQLKLCLITAAIVFAMYLPWLIVFIRQTMSAHNAFWLGALSPEAVLVAFLQPFAYREQFPKLTFGEFLKGVTVTQYMAFALATILAVYGLTIAWRKRVEEEAGFDRLVSLVYLGVVVSTILVSIVLVPLFFSRYLLVVSGLFLIMVVFGLGRLPGKYLPWIAAVVLTLLNVFTIKDIYTQYYNHPMRQLVEKLDGVIQPGDLIITTDSYSLGPAFYYLPDAVHYHQNNPAESRWGSVLNPFVPPLYYEKDLTELLSTHKSLWYITSNSGGSMPFYTVVPGINNWVLSGAPVTMLVSKSPIFFRAQKYVRLD